MIMKLLMTNRHVLKFVTEKQFKDSLPKECLIDNLIDTAEEHRTAVTDMIGIFLNRFGEGFSTQKGAIFGFGKEKDDDTKTVLKIGSLDKKSMEELNKVPIHNLGEERAVGMINYEIGLRGKQYLNTASRNMVLNKSRDLMMDSKDFRKF